MDRQPAPALAVISAQATDPGDDGDHAVGPLVRGHGCPEVDEGVPPGSRCPYQVRRRPMATSSLTTGSSR